MSVTHTAAHTAPPAGIPGRPCSIAAALQLVGEKWALLAIREIAFGNCRFDAITRNTGAPRDRLAARLRAMDAAGVVVRQQYSEHPPRFEYHLTEAGRDLGLVLQALRAWGTGGRSARHPRCSSTPAATTSTPRWCAGTAAMKCSHMI